MNLAMCEVPVHPVEHLTEADIANLPVLPMTQSADGTWYCDGESTQDGTPSPDNPIPITNTYPAGTYKAICGDKVYKVVLDDDLRSVPNVADRVVIDAGRGKLKIEKGIGYIESYTDETVETVYMSSTGELTEGATVIYQLSTPTNTQSIPTQLLTIQSGRSAQLLNTVNDKADFLKVGGDSWQLVQEKGKNLISNIKTDEIPNNSTLVAYLEANKSYTVSFDSDRDCNVVLQDVYNNKTLCSFGDNVNIGRNSKSFTVTENTENFKFYTSNGLVAKDVQIELGSTATPYEPYQPAMPSPEYPSEIVSVGGKMQSCGWNLFDVKKAIETATGGYQDKTYFKFDNGKTYNISCISRVESYSIWLAISATGFNSPIENAKLLFSSIGKVSMTVTIPDDGCEYYLYLCYSGRPSNSQYMNFFNGTLCEDIQITSKTHHPYDRHRGNSITLPTLRGLPDGTRDVMYADRKAKRAWVERKVGVKEFDGSEPFVLTGIKGDNYQGFALKSETYNALSEKHTTMCNIFQYSRNEGILNSCSQDNVEYGLRFTVSTGIVPNKTVNELKAYLAQKYSDGEPVIFYYAISAPVIEELPYSDYLLDTCQWETNISFVDCNENLNPKIEVGCKVLGR